MRCDEKCTLFIIEWKETWSLRLRQNLIIDLYIEHLKTRIDVKARTYD
jgi:hypothetical protein